jgi:hypothetical protein
MPVSTQNFLYPLGWLLLSGLLLPFSAFRLVSLFGSWLSDQIAGFLKSPRTITSGLLSHSGNNHLD